MREELLILWAVRAITTFFKPKALLMAENLCLRQQLLVLQRGRWRPQLDEADRRFWILACRWFSGWRESLLVVKPRRCWAGTARGGGPTGAGAHAVEGRAVGTGSQES